MKSILNQIILLLICGFASAQTMHIGLYNHKNIEEFTFSVRQGKYLLICDGTTFGEYKNNNIFFINKKDNKVEVRDRKNLVGTFNEVRLVNNTDNSVFTLRAIGNGARTTEYDDAVYFKVIDNKLQAINHVDLEKYIAGVIEAEGGINAELEYYKAQAVLIRTYTIKNIYKHAEEGFNLCDGVHCQAYHGRSARNKLIYEATTSTAGEVLIDQDSILVMSPFHSSCGGQTSSAGIYWQSDLPYLQSVKDPFCVDQRNYNWNREISTMEWFAFLRKKGISNPEKYCTVPFTVRKKYLANNPHTVTYREVRERFGLRSTYFSVSRAGSKVRFTGHGYGHGIGMCQIGAMEMAKVGYTYIDIIHFYFQNIDITDYRNMELHRY